MLRRILKVLLYVVAALTVVLAVAVGLLRIALPQVPEYRDEIIARISETIDGDIAFDRLDARWRLLGPELIFHDVIIGERLGERRIRPIEAERVTVGVSLGRLLLARELEVRRISIAGAALDVRRDSEGWWLQDALHLPSGDGAPPIDVPQGIDLPVGRALDLRLQDVVLRYEDRLNEREPVTVALEAVGMAVHRRELRIDATIAPSDGDARVVLLANGRMRERSLRGVLDGDWSLSADLDAVSAELMRRILPSAWRLPQSGRTDLTADAELIEGRLHAAVLTIDADRLVPPDGGDESKVAGRIEWSRDTTGWLCAVSDFVVGVADRQWPAADLTVGLARDAEGTALRFDASNVTVYDIPYLASFLPGVAADALRATGLSGTLRDGEGLLRFRGGKSLARLTAEDLVDYEVSAAFDGIGVAPTAGLPGVRNVTGSLRLTRDAGRVRIDSRDAALLLPALFDGGLALDRVAGTLVWRDSGRGVSLLSDSVQVEAASFTADSSLQLLLPPDGAAPEIDLQADWSLGDVVDVGPLLPDALLRPKLYGWLSQALEAGALRDGRFEFRGALNRFPFDDGEGSFRATARAEGVTMRYAREFPIATNLDAQVALDGLTLSTTENSGETVGVVFEDVNARIDDLRDGRLSIRTRGAAPLPSLYRFIGETPLRRVFGSQYENLGFEGNGRYDVALSIPLRAVRDFIVDVTLETSDASVALQALPHAITGIDGSVRIDRQGAYADNVAGTLLGQPVTMAMTPVGDGDSAGLLLSGRGSLDAAALTGTLGLPLAGRVDGRADYAAEVLLPRRAPGSDAVRPVTVEVTSDLRGLAISLPEPVGKTAEAGVAASANLTLGETLDARAGFEDRFDVALQAARAGDAGFTFDRLTVHLGEGRALLPAVPGVFIDGTTDRLRLGDWLGLRLADTGWLTENLVSAAVEVDDLYAFGQRIRDARASLERSGDAWLVDVQSEGLEGAISVPRNLSGGEPVVLDMRRLHLLEADPDASGDADPTAFPPLRIRAASFALGDRNFGALDATIDKVGDGLEATRIASAAAAFSVEGSGAWRVAPGGAAGSRSSLTVEVKSSDVKRMMNALGYSPGINAASLTSTVDVAWDGGPSKDFVSSLDGDVSVRISNGTLDEVEPGAGRVVGLISVAELPRRLALDFRDVFQKGFNFDEIVGDFRLANGDAYTCNLRLTGPSADVGLIGRASLDRRNYNQTAIVSVKVGNTLPAVGAVVAGPQVGAALLLFSQIFKKPLQGMTEVYYQINGSWDEPDIGRTDAARFVATSELAGCLVDNGG